MFFLTQINPGDPQDYLTHNGIDFRGERNVHLKWGGAWKQNVSAVKTLLSLQCKAVILKLGEGCRSADKF